MSLSHRAAVVCAAAASFLLIVGTSDACAQGCIASRLNAPSGAVEPEGQTFYVPSGRWQADFGYRWYRSHRHFIGSVEQNAENLAKGLAKSDRSSSEVINHVHIPELTLSYGVSDRLSLSADLPFLIALRRSPANTQRPTFETGASGIGDLSLTGRFWLANPVRHYEQNLALGLGIKMPTGNDHATDTFIDSVDPVTGQEQTSVRPVDQSIQPGDGGWGFIAEAEAFKTFGRVTAYVTGSYLFNPQEQLDYLRNPTNANPDPSSAYYSITDQYGARVGLGTAVRRFGFSLSARLEGVPSSDVFGGSMGRRRPGYSISIEPGVSYSWRGYALSLSTPYFVRRVRTQNISDKLATEETGVFHNGDAAFADYMVIAGVSRRF